MTRIAAALWLLVIGCGNGEPATTEAVDDAAVVEVAPVKLDLLLVIDDSSSMCQEQAALAAAIPAFLDRLKDVDYRIAVVTTDVLSEEKKGQFQFTWTTEFPFACAEARPLACLPDTTGDKSCADTFGKGWACDGPDKPKQVVNCNGSFNSKCKRACATDAECDNDPLLSGHSYKCLKPSGDPKNTACILRPPTAECPASEGALETMTADVGCAFLTNGTAPKLLPCITLVGTHQNGNANRKSGLAASLLALEPGAGCPSFLRSDAWLGVIYMTNDDDCSTTSDILEPQQYGTCACLKAEPDGPLMNVAAVATRLRALKTDPSRMFIGAIAGDSTSPDPSTKKDDQVAYFKSKCNDCDDPTAMQPLLFNTYICANDSGQADFGSRYAALVSEFGDHGVFENLCSGVGPSLSTIGIKLATLLKP